MPVPPCPVTTQLHAGTLRLLLSATTSMRGKRWLLTIPFNEVEYDGLPGSLCRAFSVRGLSFDPPAGTRVLGLIPYRTTNSTNPRKTVVAGVRLLLECDEDAVALDDQVLILTLDGAATESVTGMSELVLPTITPTGGTPWSLTDSAGSTVGIAVEELPSSIGALTYKGTWNADTNTPTLSDGSGEAGDFYIVDVAGDTEIDGVSDWIESDWIIASETEWQKVRFSAGFLRASNNLSDVADADEALANINGGSMAKKFDAADLIDLEAESGTVNLTSGNVKRQILHLTGKPDDTVTLQLPASQAGTWTFINETTGGQEIRVAATGGLFNPQVLAMRPGADELFVGLVSSNTIAVLDPATGEVLRTLAPAGLGQPNALAFSTDGDTLYVAVSAGAGTLGVKELDPDTGAIGTVYVVGTTGTTIGTAPRGLLVDDDNNAIWVACAGSNTGPIPTKVSRIHSGTGVVTTFTITDDGGDVGASYGARELRLNADASKVYLFGAVGSGHASGSGYERQMFVIDPADNSYDYFTVGGSQGGGLETDADNIYVLRGNRSLRYYDLGTNALVNGLAVGNGTGYLLRIGTTLYASNTTDKTLTVYDLGEDPPAEQPLISLDYGPGMMVEAGGKIWVTLPANNAMALIDPATGTTERLVALGPLETLVLADQVVQVASDGNRLWDAEPPTPTPVPALIQQNRIFDPQEYFERGYLSVAKTNFLTWTLHQYTASASQQVPYPRVVKTVGTDRDLLLSDYIPVQRGARLHFSAWVMRPASVTGTAGSFTVRLNLFDKDKRPAGTAVILSNNPTANGNWNEIADDYDLPLTHTAIENSDGGPICYIQVLISVNAPPSGNPSMQELQWGAVRVEYADTARTQTLYANEATETATVGIGDESFEVEPDADPEDVQTSIRSTGGDNGAVVVSGGTSLTTGTYSGAYVFTWPPGITPAPLTIVDPLDETWTTQQDTSSALAFTDLVDVPSSYTGAAGKVLTVKGDASGVEFVDLPADGADGADGAGVPAGGSTGQVLAKINGTDYNTQWVTPSSSGIPATIADAKGDLIAATAADTVARLPVGSNGQVLTADSGEATGLKWDEAAGGAEIVDEPYEGDGDAIEVYDDEDEGFGEGAFLDLASEAEAEAGTAADVLMTPERTAQAIAALAGGGRLYALNYEHASDTSFSITASTWTDIVANQSFTITGGSSTLEISVYGYILGVGFAGSSVGAQARIVIDSAGTPVTKVISGTAAPSGGLFNFLDGTGLCVVTGLSAGSHTIKVQLKTTENGSVYLRAASVLEAATINIMEQG